MIKSVKVGLIAAPELAEDIANKLLEPMTVALTQHVSKETNWKIEIKIDSLTGAAETVLDIFEKAVSYKEVYEWDYIICLTDLPIFHQKKVVIADMNEERSIGLISLPAFGFRPFLKRVKKVAIYMCKEMHPSVQLNQEDSNEIINEGSKTFSKHSRSMFPLTPSRKVQIKLGKSGDFHSRFLVVPQLYGRICLLLGMTLANSPFKMMSSLTNVIAIAFATGAFGMIFTTIWEVSHIFSNLRLTVITVAAIFGMVVWIVIAHNLWEKISLRENKQIRKLYNLTTALTLIIAISAYYSVIFILFFGTALVLIPPDFLDKVLELKGSVSFVNYLKIAWFCSSISIVVGAIGAGLKNEELVRNSTYGYRQYKRYEKYQDE